TYSTPDAVESPPTQAASCASTTHGNLQNRSLFCNLRHSRRRDLCIAQLQAQVAPLTARIEAARYVIAVLIGEFPEQLGNELKKPKMLPALPGRLHAGLPIDLLRCRPDIAEGERELASATALIGVARPLCLVCCDWF